MSNASIVRRIESLLGSLESGELSLKSFAREFPLHNEAIENLEYSSIKEAQMAAIGFEIDGDMAAEGFGNHDQMVTDAIEWVRSWLQAIPQ